MSTEEQTGRTVDVVGSLRTAGECLTDERAERVWALLKSMEKNGQLREMSVRRTPRTISFSPEGSRCMTVTCYKSTLHRVCPRQCSEGIKMFVFGTNGNGHNGNGNGHKKKPECQRRSKKPRG